MSVRIFNTAVRKCHDFFPPNVKNGATTPIRRIWSKKQCATIKINSTKTRKAWMIKFHWYLTWPMERSKTDSGYCSSVVFLWVLRSVLCRERVLFYKQRFQLLFLRVTGNHGLRECPRLCPCVSWLAWWEGKCCCRRNFSPGREAPHISAIKGSRFWVWKEATSSSHCPRKEPQSGKTWEASRSRSNIRDTNAGLWGGRTLLFLPLMRR